MPTLLCSPSPVALPLCALRQPRRRRTTVTSSSLTLDGVRVQELFAGMDPVIANATEAESGIYEHRGNPQALLARHGRRAPRGADAVLLEDAGARRHGGRQPGASAAEMTVRNNQWFSYPGYSEILTGEPQPEIKSNDFVRYPHETVLDYVHRRLA